MSLQILDQHQHHMTIFTLRYLISLPLASSLDSPLPAQAFPWIQARATIRVAWATMGFSNLVSV